MDRISNKECETLTGGSADQHRDSPAGIVDRELAQKASLNGTQKTCNGNQGNPAKIDSLS